MADLLGGHHDSTPSPQATTASASLLDLNYPQHHLPPQQHQQQNAHADFLGMTSGPSPPVSGNMNSNPYGQPTQNNKSNDNYQRSGSFDSFGQNQGGAFGGLGTPWKS